MIISEITIIENFSVARRINNMFLLNLNHSYIFCEIKFDKVWLINFKMVGRVQRMNDEFFTLRVEDVFVVDVGED